LLAFGYWSLAAGLWLLAFGCWPLAAGFWLWAVTHFTFHFNLLWELFTLRVH